ncbi:MAG: glycosyltransferase [Anaerolineae bacterium]|nr:glycosyltransferase [Anaerolineae bacterium]
MTNAPLKQDIQIATPNREQEMPKVSIITPNYNHAQYVGDAIRSVLAQDYQNFEMLIIDDGSTDNSREVVAQFTDDRIKYIWQENKGLSAARNTGINIAKGELIGLLDADDIYETDFLSTLVSILTTNPELDGITCGYQFVDHGNKPLYQREARLIEPSQFYEALISGNFLVPESMLAHRYCYEAVGPYDETLRACEDWDIWLKMTHKFKIGSTDKILNRHRVLPGSMSSDPIRMLNNRIAVITKHFGPEPMDASEGTEIQRRAYGYAYLTTIVEYLQYHHLDRAYECLLKMVTIYPELLKRYETFYELGFGDQPKGSRGDFSTLNVTKNAENLFGLLDKLFDDPQISPELRKKKQQVYAQAYFALGMLSYGARETQAAKKFLTKAVFTDPEYSFNRQLVTTLAKSFLSPQLINQLSSQQRRTV